MLYFVTNFIVNQKDEKLNKTNRNWEIQCMENVKFAVSPNYIVNKGHILFFNQTRMNHKFRQVRCDVNLNIYHRMQKTFTTTDMPDNVLSMPSIIKWCVPFPVERRQFLNTPISNCDQWYMNSQYALYIVKLAN